MMKRLWEVEHPYHCMRGCYFNNDCFMNHDSWADFVSGGFHDSDEDMNLLFRWDWREPDEDDGDEASDGIELELFFFLQRKAYPMSVTIQVTREDEPAIRMWLEKRFQTVKALWSPFTDEDQ